MTNYGRIVLIWYDDDAIYCIMLCIMHLITHGGCVMHICVGRLGHSYTPLQRSWKGGILVSPCSSVRLSVCGQNRVRSVSSTLLIRSISYLHILSSNFRRCVACNVCLKLKNLQLWRILKICNFAFFFWLGIQYDSMLWLIMRRWGVSSECRHSSCSSWFR